MEEEKEDTRSEPSKIDLYVYIYIYIYCGARWSQRKFQRRYREEPRAKLFLFAAA